jgi:hypothetical protein
VASLLAARQAFPKITKEKQGQAGNRPFMYAPLDVVLDAVMPHLWANGLLLTQGTDGHDLVTRLDHISGEWREHRMPINAEHANMQSYGIELTYRRRYAIQPMLGIVTEDDTDGDGGQKRVRGADHTTQTSSNAQSGSQANRSAFQEVQPEIQDALRKHSRVIDATATTNALLAKTKVEQACAEWPNEDPNLVKMALWSILDSKTKSAIRKIA